MRRRAGHVCVRGSTNLKQKLQRLEDSLEGKSVGESAEEDLKGNHIKVECEVIAQRVG